MADQILPAYELSARYPWPGLRLTRAFRIAVDIRKLLLCAAGLALMSNGEWLFQFLPFAPPTAMSGAGAVGQVEPLYVALRRTTVEPALANEMLRVPEWSPATVWRIATRWDVVLRPARSVVEPVLVLLKPGVTWSDAAWGITRLLWALAVWSIFGGAVMRMAAVQFARDVKISVWTALKFSIGKFLSFLTAPLLPLTGIGLLCLVCGLGGLVGKIPGAGPVIVACAWFVALALAFLMMLMLLGVAAGWPLMWAAISTEGSDAFDGFSRSYSFVYSRPWHYLGYGLTALVYGSVVTVFLTAVFGAIVHLAAWSVGTGLGSATVAELQSTSSSLIAPDAPSPPAAAGGISSNPQSAIRNPQSAMSPSRSEGPTLAAHIVGGWLFLVSLLLGGFTWSYFWTASTILYFLLRNSDDATRFDEVWLPEEEEKDDLLPLVGVAASEQPVIERPIRRPEERAAARETAPSGDTV